MLFFPPNLNDCKKQFTMSYESQHGQEDDDSYVLIYRDIMNSHKLSRHEQSSLLHNIFLRSSGCKCCKRHSREKPRSIRKWSELQFEEKDGLPCCNCSCRHVSRQICRLLGHDWCTQLKAMEHVSVKLWQHVLETSSQRVCLSSSTWEVRLCRRHLKS